MGYQVNQTRVNGLNRQHLDAETLHERSKETRRQTAELSLLGTSAATRKDKEISGTRPVLGCADGVCAVEWKPLRRRP